MRALQGLVNRGPAPSLFFAIDAGDLHDTDWLTLLTASRQVAPVVQPTADARTDLGWYFQHFRSQLSGYVLFDASTGAADPSPYVAMSLAGLLNAIPIYKGDDALVKLANDSGLTQVADVSGKDYTWLRNSEYWPRLNKKGIGLIDPGSLLAGVDYLVANNMPVFWDDFRQDPGLSTMSAMLGDQLPGGAVYGWSSTDETHREDTFIKVLSRFNQGIMDLPGNTSVYMHFPLQRPLSNTPTPPLPTRLAKHYVAFFFSDGDNPQVVVNKLTSSGSDLYASPLRGSLPVGWTLPPSMVDYAPPILNAIYAAATPNDEFIAGTSGYAALFPSLFPDKQSYATTTQRYMAQLGMHELNIMDVDGQESFSNTALAPLLAQTAVQGAFFNSFNAKHQPTCTILWSDDKPVLPSTTMYRPAGHTESEVVDTMASYINAQPKDATSPSGYTVVYVDLWSAGMHDLATLAAKLEPDVQVVRPDVLVQLARTNIRH